MKEGGLGARHAAVNEFLTDEHKLYRLAFSESNLDRKWDRVITAYESILSSANDGHVLVFRPRGDLQLPVYVYLYTQWPCVRSLLGLECSIG
jgi:hypothetical protein